MNRQTGFAFGATMTSISRIHIRRRQVITQTTKAKVGTLAARIATLALWIRNRRKGEEDDKRYPNSRKELFRKPKDFD